MVSNQLLNSDFSSLLLEPLSGAARAGCCSALPLQAVVAGNAGTLGSARLSTTRAGSWETLQKCCTGWNRALARASSAPTVPCHVRLSRSGAGGLPPASRGWRVLALLHGAVLVVLVAPDKRGAPLLLFSWGLSCSGHGS